MLFREFWNAASAIPGKWALPFDPADPVNTPSGMAPATGQAMLGALRAAAQKLAALGMPLDGRLGDYQSDTRAGLRVPLHGGIGDIDGSYNSIHMSIALDAGGYHDVAWGSSYIQTVTFDDNGPVAQAMLVYGQSTDPKSPYYADQLRAVFAQGMADLAVRHGQDQSRSALPDRDAVRIIFRRALSGFARFAIVRLPNEMVNKIKQLGSSETMMQQKKKLTKRAKCFILFLLRGR